MPSFLSLSKIVGRKKDGKQDHKADAAKSIPDNEEKKFRLSFFKFLTPQVKPKRLLDSLPIPSLDLGDKFAYNDYVQESSPEAIFSDTVLGQRRLNPTEALVLIRACSKAIISEGLKVQGIMTPHWRPASQERLISKFLISLDATSTSTYISNLENEVGSIHDVAAVFRWALRHVQLLGDNFGTDDGWYKAFLDAEAANDYPPKAFSEKLAPNLPTWHLDLLTSTLEVFSSFAAFSESNETSGSKLSKMFGLWLLTARRVEDEDDWRTFYARWERTGRMLEHLLLARIRDQATDQQMPAELLKLVARYPYTHGLSSPRTDLQLLPYPQFTTKHYPALFVRVQYEVATQIDIPRTKIIPSVLIAEAFSTKVEEGEFVELWSKITNASSRTCDEHFGHVFTDETLHLLSLVTDQSEEVIKSPTFSLNSSFEPCKQTFSSTGAAFVSSRQPSDESAPLATPGPFSPISIGSDWEQCSTSFGLPRSVVITESTGDSSHEAINPKSPSKARQEVITACHMEVIELDEAFVDFWSDTLLDPIASDWPTFVICEFKSALVPDLTFGPGDESTKKTLNWLVLEQVYNIKSRPIPSSPMTTPEETSARSASAIAQSPSDRCLSNLWSVAEETDTPRVKIKELIREDEEKLEKAKCVGVTGPEVSSPALSVDARPSSSFSDVGASTVPAADATTTAVRSATEESGVIQEMDLSTAPEPVAETLEPIVVSESMDGAPRQDVIPAEAEVPLPDTDVVRAAVVIREGKIINLLPAAMPVQKTLSVEKDRSVRTTHPRKLVRFAYRRRVPYSSSIVPSSIGLIPPSLVLPIPGSSMSAKPHRYLVPNAILWNLLDPPSTSIHVRQHISSQVLREPASEPILPFITITSQHLPWTFIVRTSNMRYATVSDVLESLYSSFRRNVTAKEFYILSEEDRQRAARAYIKRYKRLEHRGEDFELEKKRGMKRVDFLMGRTHFGGLSVDKRQPREWHLQTLPSTMTYDTQK